MATRTVKTRKAKAARKHVKAKPARVSARPNARAARTRAIGKRDFASFRRLLVEERARLLEELEAMEEHTPEVEDQVGMDIGGGYDEDLADVASSTFEREKGLALESSVQQLLTQVEEALARIDEGTYGICVRCGNPIDSARLKVLPYATLCIRCKEEEERTNHFR
ncbi:MAG TPA: TraR/DksA C4-type zinc finger protein [bacterium]|nr:TraR/DksA C4-type zinc finger protein [bacterium]